MVVNGENTGKKWPKETLVLGLITDAPWLQAAPSVSRYLITIYIYIYMYPSAITYIFMFIMYIRSQPNPPAVEIIQVAKLI